MSEMADIAQIIRVEFEGMQIAMKVGSASIKTMQKAAKFLLNLLKYEKSKGKTGLKKLLMRGGDLQVFQFEEKDLKQVQKFCKKYGILYSLVPKLDKDSDMRELLFHAEATPRINQMLQKMKEPGKAGIKSMDSFLEGTDEKKLNAFNDYLKEDEKVGNPDIHADVPLENLITKVGDYAMKKQSTSVEEIKKDLGLEDEAATHAVGQLSKLGVISAPDENGRFVTIMEKEDYEKKLGRLSELNNRMRSIAADKNLDLSSTVLEKKMIVKETPTQVKVKIPGTDGPEPVFVWLDKKDVVASNDGKSFLANIDKGHSYITHDKRDNQIGSIPGLLLITRHFNRDKEVDQSVLDKFIKAPVHEKKRVR